MTTHFRTASVDGHRIFYREAGIDDAPALLLLHGFPSSSHMYRYLIPQLADAYRVVAPDLPGFGFSDSPERGAFRYTFENLTTIMALLALHRNAWPHAVCPLCVRLWRPHWMAACHAPPRAYPRPYLPKRKCLYRGTERRMESHTAILGIAHY